MPVAAWPKAWGLQLLACWDFGFECCRGHCCLSLVSVVCCQVEVFVMGWSLVQRNPTEHDVSEWDHGTLTVRIPRLTRAVEKKKSESRWWNWKRIQKNIYIFLPDSVLSTWPICKRFNKPCMWLYFKKMKSSPCMPWRNVGFGCIVPYILSLSTR